LPLACGVTGSVGFTLASGFDVLRFDSDLDLLVRAPSVADTDALRVVAALVRNLEARVDVQVETPLAAFVAAHRVLLSTNCGPVLADDVWSTLDVTPRHEHPFHFPRSGRAARRRNW
jgi:phosphoribosyl-dephospho-CoA transferase